MDNFLTLVKDAIPTCGEDQLIRLNHNIDQYLPERISINNEERKKLERISATALHVLEPERQVDVDNLRGWPTCRKLVNAEQWLISHQSEGNNIKPQHH